MKATIILLALCWPVLSFAQNQTLDSVFTTLDRASDQSNSEIDCYKPANSAISGGLLTLTAKADANITCPWRSVSSTCPGVSIGASGNCTFQKSASMIQYSSKTFQYGELQIKAKVAAAPWWPAIWLEGSNCQIPNLTTADNLPLCDWPHVGSMEIDIAEWLAADGRTTVRQNVWTAAGVEDGCAPTISDASTNFHVYQIIRTSTSVQFGVDGSLCLTTFTGSKASTDAMFLMINIAQASATSPSNSSTVIDWVKQCDGNGVTCDNGITGAAAGNMGTGFFDDFTGAASVVRTSSAGRKLGGAHRIN